MKDSPLYQRLLGMISSAWIPQPDKPEETPELTLHALWLTAQGMPASVGLAGTVLLKPLDEDQSAVLEQLVNRRLAGTPVAHLTGRQRFMGLEMLAGPEALIPRAETEILAGIAVSVARDLVTSRAGIRVLDVCCGSGNVALAVASAVPGSTVFGSDLSHDAASLASRNAMHLGLADRAVFRQGDMFSAFASDEFFHSFDLLTCNPPYISSGKVSAMDAEIARHEPRLAFDGGMLGVTILKRLISEAPKFLKSGSMLCFEVGLGQGIAMARMLGNTGDYADIATFADSRGDVRAIKAAVV